MAATVTGTQQSGLAWLLGSARNHESCLSGRSSHKHQAECDIPWSRYDIERFRSTTKVLARSAPKLLHRAYAAGIGVGCEWGEQSRHLQEVNASGHIGCKRVGMEPPAEVPDPQIQSKLIQEALDRSHEILDNHRHGIRHQGEVRKQADDPVQCKT